MGRPAPISADQPLEDASPARQGQAARGAGDPTRWVLPPRPPLPQPLPPAGAGACPRPRAHCPWLPSCSAALTMASLAAEASLRSLSSLLLATRGDAGLVRRTACQMHPARFRLRLGRLHSVPLTPSTCVLPPQERRPLSLSGLARPLTRPPLPPPPPPLAPPAAGWRALLSDSQLPSSPPPLAPASEGSDSDADVYDDLPALLSGSPSSQRPSLDDLLCPWSADGLPPRVRAVTWELLRCARHAHPLQTLNHPAHCNAAQAQLSCCQTSPLLLPTHPPMHPPQASMHLQPLVRRGSASAQAAVTYRSRRSSSYSGAGNPAGQRGRQQATPPASPPPLEGELQALAGRLAELVSTHHARLRAEHPSISAGLKDVANQLHRLAAELEAGPPSLA